LKIFLVPITYNIDFREIYLNSYLVGEGLSGFIPAIAALIQGAGGNPECRNVSVPTDDPQNPVKARLHEKGFLCRATTFGSVVRLFFLM
jgi:hypothetical protein